MGMRWKRRRAAVPYVDQVHEGNPPGAQYDLVLELPPGRSVYEIHQCIARDVDSAVTAVWIGISDGNAYYWLHKEAASSANQFIKVARHFYVPAGWKIVARFADATAGDDLYLTVNGLRWDVVEEA